MNSPADDVMDMLDTTSAGANIGVFGTDLFVNREPTTPAACITIYDTAGMAPRPEAASVGIEHPTIHVRIRGTKGGQQAAYAVARSIYEALHSKTNETWNSMRYIWIFATSSPALMGFDDNDKPIYTVNFRIARTPA